MKNPFEEGDYVYHYSVEGKGKITELYPERAEAFVNFKSECESDMYNTDELSFTPYTLKDGGWSHERPDPYKDRIKQIIDSHKLCKQLVLETGEELLLSSIQMDSMHPNAIIIEGTLFLADNYEDSRVKLLEDFQSWSQGDPRCFGISYRDEYHARALVFLEQYKP